MCIYNTPRTLSPTRFPMAKPRGTAESWGLFPDWQGLSYMDPPSYSQKGGPS